MAFGNVPCTTDALIVGSYNIAIRQVGDTTYHDLGSTTGGVTITQTNTYQEVENDQSPNLQTKFRINEKFTVDVTLRDVTLDKLRAIYSSKNNPVTVANVSTLDIGGQEICSFPEEWEMVICGPGPGCGCRVFEFPRIVFTPDTVEYTIQRSTPVELSVQFEALAQCPSGKVLTITDVVDCAAEDLPPVDTDPLPDYPTV